MRFGVGLDLWSKDDISTTFEIPKPVATEQQVAKWTAEILQAADFLTLKKVADEIGGYHLDDDTRAGLVATWTSHKEEIDAAGK